jgi:hypothetical protein
MYCLGSVKLWSVLRHQKLARSEDLMHVPGSRCWNFFKKHISDIQKGLDSKFLNGLFIQEDGAFSVGGRACSRSVHTVESAGTRLLTAHTVTAVHTSARCVYFWHRERHTVLGIYGRTGTL